MTTFKIYVHIKMPRRTATQLASDGAAASRRKGFGVDNKVAREKYNWSSGMNREAPYRRQRGADAIDKKADESYNTEASPENIRDLGVTQDIHGNLPKTHPHTGKDVRLDDGKVGPKTIGDRLQKVRDMLPGNTTLMFGLAVVTLSGYASAILDATDGETAKITSITIVDTSSTGTVLTIAYTPPNEAFNPCINDSIDLSGEIPLFGGQSGLKVTGLPSTTSVQVTVPVPNVKTFPSSSSPVPTLMNVGSFVDHSSIANQFTDSIVGVGTIVADTVAQVGGVVIDDTGQLVGKAGGAVGGAFCSTFKILCNKWLWLGILLLIIIGIILAIMSKKN
jgi:hypothetical protein